MINDSLSFAVALKKCVEDAAGRKLSPLKDFMFLFEQIFSRLHVILVLQSYHAEVCRKGKIRIVKELLPAFDRRIFFFAE